MADTLYWNFKDYKCLFTLINILELKGSLPLADTLLELRSVNMFPFGRYIILDIKTWQIHHARYIGTNSALFPWQTFPSYNGSLSLTSLKKLMLPEEVCGTVIPFMSYGRVWRLCVLLCVCWDYPRLVLTFHLTFEVDIWVKLGNMSPHGCTCRCQTVFSWMLVPDSLSLHGCWCQTVCLFMNVVVKPSLSSSMLVPDCLSSHPWGDRQYLSSWIWCQTVCLLMDVRARQSVFSWMLVLDSVFSWMLVLDSVSSWILVSDCLSAHECWGQMVYPAGSGNPSTIPNSDITKQITRLR